MKENVIMLSDSYKYSHWKQYPENMKQMFVYAEARSGKVYPKTVFFGIQYFILKYLMNPVTMDDVNQAEKFASGHGIPFNKEGWEYIVNEYNGYIPVKIRAVKEGSVIPTGNILFSIESTDEKVPWVAGFLETLFLKVWYTSNIATRSYYIRELLEKYWKETSSDDVFDVQFQFHNFGDRGSSSVESAGIGGVAHLTQFMGTDNFNSLRYAFEFYDEEDAGYSIPATEHSTTTSWLKENELKIIMNHIEVNKTSVIVAAVCDSYNYFKTVDAVTSGEFKEKIESEEYPKFVIRPDSGNPVEVINKTLDIMEKNEVKFTINSKGYKEFTKYGIIWGDGINEETIKEMLEVLKERGYASSNIAFGSGGWLMQSHNRDTQGWALKCSSIIVDEGSPIEDGEGNSVWEPYLVQRDVFKDPITAPNKKSKKGELTLWYNKETDEYFTDDRYLKVDDRVIQDCLETIYENGEVKLTTLTAVREMSR